MVNNLRARLQSNAKGQGASKKTRLSLKGIKKICQGVSYPAFRSTRQLYLSRAAGLGPSVSPRPGARPARPLPSPTGPAPAPRPPVDFKYLNIRKNPLPGTNQPIYFQYFIIKFAYFIA